MTDIKLLRVFIASPSDVQPERDALANVVRDVNSTLAGLASVQLRLLTWQEDVEPAVGADPQAIINSQIGTDYDVFIGILWKHFGTPTPRAESGTLEEFERAIELQQERPTSVSVMFYFKTAPVPIDVDTSQLKRVQAFRRKYSDRGLYGTFGSTSDFASQLQIRLTRTALTWSRQGVAPDTSSVSPAPSSLAPPETPSPPEEDDGVEDGVADNPDEDVGFLDLVEEGTASFENVRAVSERITKHLNDLGSAMKRATAELDTARAGGKPVPLAEQKRASNAVAKSMEDFSTRVETELAPFRSAYDRGIRAYGRAATLLGDFGGDTSRQLTSAKETTMDLEQSVAGSQTKLREFKVVIEGLPRITLKFNRARRRVLGTLDNFDATMTSARTAAGETMELFEELLQRAGPNRQLGSAEEHGGDA